MELIADKSNYVGQDGTLVNNDLIFSCSFSLRDCGRPSPSLSKLAALSEIVDSW